MAGMSLNAKGLAVVTGELLLMKLRREFLSLCSQQFFFEI
jgi:hypothetical protein